MRHVRRQPGALGVILGTLLALVGALLVGAGPAFAAVAAPTELTPNGSVLQGSPVLSWRHVTGATSYNVELSRSHLFDTVIFSTTTTNRHATPAAALPTGELYWRVRSVTSSGTSAWASAMFENGERPGPGRTTWNGQTLPQPDSPPILRWQAVPGATGYEVEVDGTNSGFITASRYTTQTTSLVVPDPQENGVYDWRVRALLGSGVNTAWSAPDTYVIGALPIVDGVVTPLNSPDTSVTDVVFDWDPVPGAVTYELQVDDDDSFSAPIDTVVVKGTRYSRPQTYNNNQYWWRVRARNIFGNAQEWTDVPVRQFRRHWPDAPALVYPQADTAVGDDFYYQWEPVPLASRYRLEVGQDPNFSPGYFDWCYTTETTYTPGFKYYRGLGRTAPADKCMPHEPGQTYYWRVQALDDSDRSDRTVNGIFSAIQSFRYDPGMVQPLSPRGGETVDIPTLRWTAFPDAVKYEVTLSWNGGKTTATTASYSWTPVNLKLDPTKGPFEWTVRAVDANGDKTAAPILADRFSLSGSLPTSGAAALTPLSPSAGSPATARFPTLRWEPLAGADHYRIHLAAATDTTFLTLSSRFHYNEGSDINANYLRPGAYKWFVTAHTVGGATLGSGELGAFQIADLPQVSGQSIALHGTGLDSGASCDYSLASPIDEERVCTAMRGTPVLDWDPVPDAGYYMVYVARDPDFTDMVYGSKAAAQEIPTTQNTRWNPVWAVPDGQAGDAYYWYIRPCKADGACAPDPTVAGHAFDKRSNQVLQRTPAQAATVANDVTFTWDDYLSTNQDSAYMDPNTREQSSQAARSYHLQVGTSPAFTTIVDDVTVDQTTYTAFSKTYPDSTLYWRVQPVDGAGNKLTWGPAMEFTKASSAVVLDGPASGVAAPTQPLRWIPADFAASYDIEVYKDADVSASAINRVLSANSKQVAYSFTKPLAASNLDYAWRVRTVDVDGRKGPWYWGAFRVGGTAPVVSGPAEGATVGARDALFQWDPVASATSYKFERRNDGWTYAAETIVTSNTAHAPTSTILSGSWRVTARDASGATLGVSPWRSFTVSTPPAPDTTAPRVIKRSPVTVAKVRANFVAVFNERVYNVSGRTMKLFMKGSTKPVAARVTLSADRKTAKLNPVRNLRRGKVYILRLNSGIKDRAGNRIRGVVWRARAS